MGFPRSTLVVKNPPAKKKKKCKKKKKNQASLRLPGYEEVHPVM